MNILDNAIKTRGVTHTLPIAHETNSPTDPSNLIAIARVTILGLKILARVFFKRLKSIFKGLDLTMRSE
jgi:hypothetical protein